MQAIHPQINAGEKRQALYKLFAAYIHTVPLEELIKSVERARRDAQLRYVVIYRAACSYCLGRVERLEGSYLRTFALELRGQLANTLAAFVTSILAGPRGRADAERTAEPPLRQIIEVLQQVMCTHDQKSLRFLCSKSTKTVIAKSEVQNDEILCSQADAESLSVVV